MAMFLQKVAASYVVGKYRVYAHDKTGIKINCFFTIPGKGIKAGHSYDIKSGWKVFPNGKLVANTLFAGRQKKNEIF